MGLPQRKKVFFFEKTKQKTLECQSRAYPADVRKCPKVFWVFFSKKNTLKTAEK
jgi:hypothetical protein